MIKMKRLGFGIPLVTALMAFLVAPDAAQAQLPGEAMGVAVMNESNREVRVFAYHGSADERVMLGWVGGQELEYFSVPERARTSAGSYQLAVQPITPLPQIGVEAEPHPLETTPSLNPGPAETVRVVVTPDMDLVHRIIR